MVSLEFAIVHFLHIIFTVFGVGGATIATIIMMKAEKAPELMPAAMKFVESISKLIWVGLIGLIATGIITSAMGAGKGYYDPTTLAIKHIAVAVILICGLNINLRLLPKINLLAPKPGTKPAAEFIRARKHMKFSSMLSLVLWYVVVALSVIM